MILQTILQILKIYRDTINKTYILFTMIVQQKFIIEQSLLVSEKDIIKLKIDATITNCNSETL